MAISDIINYTCQACGATGRGKPAHFAGCRDITATKETPAQDLGGIDKYQEWFRAVVRKYGKHDACFLAGKMQTEASEVAEPIFKLARDISSMEPTAIRIAIAKRKLRDKIKEELSDLLWYVLMLAGLLNISGLELLEFQRQKIMAAQEKEDKANE